MAEYNTFTTLNGNFKEIYADKLQDLVPDGVVLQKKIPFNESTIVGNKYHSPVILTNENGFTYSAPSQGAFALNTASAAVHADAYLEGYQLVLESRMGYEAATRATAGGRKAFVSSTEQMIKNMVNSFAKRMELQYLYGGTGLGKVSAVSAGTSPAVLTVTAATFASGIWGGLEGASLDAYSSSTLKNSNAALVISAVDIDNRQITVTGNGTDLTAMKAITDGSGELDLYFYLSYGKEMSGIDKILTNTGSLFGISASTYSLWRANEYDCGDAALTFGKIQRAVAKAIPRGLNVDVDVLLSIDSWQALNINEAALRSYDSSYKSKASNGFNEIEFLGGNGKIRIYPHIFVKAGEAFVLPIKNIKRIGSTAMTFNIPGQKDEYFKRIDGYAGFGVMAYANEAIFIEKPASCVKLTGIVNS